jgi:hypothetical protein
MQPTTGSMHIKNMIVEIVTEEDYQEGLKRFLELSNGPQNDDELKEMYLLMDLMEKYERENCSSS